MKKRDLENWLVVARRDTIFLLLISKIFKFKTKTLWKKFRALSIYIKILKMWRSNGDKIISPSWRSMTALGRRTHFARG